MHRLLPFARTFGALATAFICTASHAQSVALAGIMGSSKALLIINGAAPKAVGLNTSHQGVRLLQIQGNTATIEFQGQRQTLRMGASPVNVGQGLGSGQRKVVLRADGRGHFGDTAYINNKPIAYMVDTGASAVGISQEDAQRLGIDFEQGRRVMIRTANGNAPAWQIRLDHVRVGDITVFGVDAVVSPQPMPFVLLGNSFLSKVNLTRNGNEMVLEQR